MESSHVISITNVGPSKSNKESKIHSSLASHLRYKQNKDTINTIHSIKVGISLVFVSLLYILDPLYDQVGENAMWAIMTVVVLFEFTAGATLGKGFNRGTGTVLGGVLGCIAAILAQNLSGVGNSIAIGTFVFISGTTATYFRQLASIKKRYDYGVMIFILTFNLVVVSGVRTHDQKVWELARERLTIILMGFIVCICVSLLVFPLWASDELHDSIVSRFQYLANSLQDCLEEYVKTEEENKHGASFTLCKSLLDSKSKDELLANFAKWEPWHGKFGFFYPWEQYLKIGEVLRELAAIILTLGGCLRASRKAGALASESETVEFESCEAIGSRIVWSMREVGESMKQMRKCEAENHTSKLKAARTELSLMIATSKIAAIENSTEALAIASSVFFLMEVVDKVEELIKEVEQVEAIAGFRAHSTPPSS
ncbi:hypothetical protein RJT34_22663 [Clitoria ternatea]|uniref:Aluminum-activated malate transporter n=1 Tax=Clitoria ternatea TaxID=43366 RepID=A0AAN9FRD7_CLITE